MLPVLRARLSVRARLAIWHTTVLAALLLGFAVVSILFLRNSNRVRTDAELLSTWAAFSGEILAEREELPTLAAATKEALGEFRFNDVAVEVVDSAGAVVGFKPAAGPPAAIDSREPSLGAARLAGSLKGRLSTAGYFDWDDSEGGYRLYAAPLEVGGERAGIVVARSLHADREMLENAAGAFALLAPLVLTLAFLGGWFLAGRSLAPVGAMSERAARISASTTSERLPVVNSADELGKLATVLNDLLDRLAEALAQQRRFMTDASHELRTPVSVIRTVADVVLAKSGRSEKEYTEALETVQREAGRLTRVVDDLFLLSRADIGERRVVSGSLYLAELVADAAQDLSPLAAERNIRFECQLPEDGAPFTGDEDLLSRALVNLMDNAIKYSRAESIIRVIVDKEAGTYRIDVEDEGRGIPAGLEERIFERFFRADNHDPAIPGAGLGLAIARWAVEVHGGELSVGKSRLGGARFTALIPISGHPASGS